MKITAARLLVTILLAGVLTSCSTTKTGKDGVDGLSESDLNAQREGRFGEGSIPRAEGEGLFRDVHFEYDSSRLTDQGRQDVEYNAEILRQRPSLKLSLEGHTDERGTAEYNLALGQDRARTVRDALAAGGITRDRLEVISYGEEVPLDVGHDEFSWQKNRRVHFSAFSNAG